MRQRIKNENELAVKKTTIEATEKGLVGEGGLSSIISYFSKTNFFKLLDERLPLPKRKDCYYPSDFIKAILALQFIYKSNATLQKLENLRENKALAKILRIKRIPSASATGDFLRRMADIEAIKTPPVGDIKKEVVRGGYKDGLKMTQNLFCEVAVMTLQRLRGKIDSTLDVDAFVIEENKKYSKWTYKKAKGTMGYGGFFGGVCVMIELEPGNHSPNDHIAARTKSCIELVQQAGLEVDNLREDAAGYVADIINYCDKHDIKFYIRAANDKAVGESIKTIKTKKEGKKRGLNNEDLERCWHEDELRIAGNKSVKVTLGTAIHAMDKTKNAFLLATKRTEITEWEKQDKTLFPDIPKTKHVHFAVATNDLEKTEKEITEFYNLRAEDSENRNKELLVDFGAGNLRCGGELGLEANRVYGYIMGMIYNMMQVFKHECIGQEERSHRLPTLCDKYVRIPAQVTYHAREVKLSLANYMKKSAKSLRKIESIIKNEVKRFSIERYAPNYGALIFRRNDILPTRIPMPDAAIALKSFPLQI